MSRALVQFNDYVSLAVMLLMLVALLAGQSSAGEYSEQDRFSVAAGIPFSAELDGRIGYQAVKAGMATVVRIGESSHFRGEDE